MNATILVLCSDAVIRSVITDTLEARGYVVLGAANLGTAVDRLREYKPDLLIIRPYIDNMAGLDDERLLYRDSLHAIEVFPKPFTAAELLAKVSEILERRA